MHNVKVLPHPQSYVRKGHSSYNRLLKEKEDYQNEGSPVYNREGLYLDKSGMCWEEWDGRAWEYDRVYFEYCLAALDAQEVSSKVVKMLKAIQTFDPSILTKEQRGLINRHEQATSIRQMSRQSRLRRIGLLKTCKNNMRRNNG